MRALKPIGIVAALLLQMLPAFANDVITNIMSPIASYQYPDNFSSAVLTNGGILSPIASYQYYEWPGTDVLNLQSSPQVSYYYQFLDAPLFNILPTSRVPTTAESTPAYLISTPPQSQLEIFAVSGFTTNPPFPLDKNRMTVVMTHGWNSDPNGWATNMAALMIANLGVASPNIVAWDWRGTAKADLPGTPAAQTHDQGIALGQALANALGSNYSKQIHFIGHSLGTLVNANAADYLHGNRFAWTNTQMTLFDEAEAATGITWFGPAIEDLIGWNGNPLSPKPSYYHPLPNQFRWADNYVAAFGLLHTNAANVILTNNFPANAPTLSGWFGALTTFHGYPMPWYDETIQTDVSALGFLWSFERGGWFSQAPATNSVYVQATSEWNLSATNWNYGTNLLNARYQAYRNSLAYAITGETPDSASVNGYGSGQNIVGALPAFNSFVFSLLTTPANNSPAPQLKAHPLGATPNDASSNTNIPAYAWMPLAVPANAVSMSFDYKIQGDWQSDSLAAAFNGTNILSVPGSQIETNVLFSSGALDVSAFAGQTNEFFIGIIGGTSTNAQVTVQNLAFSVSSPPLLQAQAAGNNCVLSWPLSASDYILQTSTNLADTNSWTAVPNVPAIVNLQNAVTNSASDGARFYRLRK
jgi:pimeloyl-ACP methyl ester carboxylesterase